MNLTNNQPVRHSSRRAGHHIWNTKKTIIAAVRRDSSLNTLNGLRRRCYEIASRNIYAVEKAINEPILNRTVRAKPVEQYETRIAKPI